MVRYLIITIISLALSHSNLMAEVSAQKTIDFYDMSEFTKEIDFALDYTSITVQKGHILNRKIGDRSLDELDDVVMEKHLREVFESYIEMYEKKLKLDTTKLKFFKDAYKAVHYKTLYSDFKNVFKGLSLKLKKKGAGFWLAMMCGITNEIIFDLIAWSISPWLLGITMSIPYNVLWVSGTTVFQRLNMKKRLMKVLGSKENYNNYMEFRKTLGDTFQRKNFDRYIVPLKTADGEISTVVINKRTIWEKLLWKMDSETKVGWKSLIRKAGLKDGAVNYFNISMFLDSNNIENTYLSSVRKSPLSKQAKVALILNHVFSTMDEEVQFKFKDKFSSSFITLNQSTSWKGMRNWTKKMLLMQDWEQVQKGFKELPDWVDVREVEEIWKQIILPQYSETIGIGYFKYRKLLTDLELMRATHFLEEDTTWSFEISSRFMAHVKKAVVLDKAPQCFNEHQKVLRFLIRELNP